MMADQGGTSDDSGASPVAVDSGIQIPADTDGGSDASVQVVQQLPPGVVLRPDSSITLSFDWSHASYLPAQPGCAAEYEAIVAVDQQMLRAVGITLRDAENLDTEYRLQPCENCGTVIPNFLLGDGGNIQVNINGIENATGADTVSAGSILFRGLTGNLEFEFSFSFADGKVLQGTFNLPIKQDLRCPGPSR